MPLSPRLPGRLLGAAQLLLVFCLPAGFVCLLLQGKTAYLLYLFWAWVWLMRLLIAWVAGLLGWRLWQRRWGRAAALAALAAADGLVLYGYQVALFVAGMAAGPT